MIEPIGYESAIPNEAQVNAATIGTLSHTLEQYEFAINLQVATIQMLKDRIILLEHQLANAQAEIERLRG